MTITTRESGDVTIVDLRGRLVVGAEGAALRLSDTFSALTPIN
jgi:hypothetical protein